MNKLFLLLLSALLIVISLQTNCEEYTGNDESVDVCRRLSTTDDNTHCCFVPDEDETTKCWQLTDDEYENIKRYISYAKQYYEMSKLRIKCSAYISFPSSLFILFSLFGLLI